MLLYFVKRLHLVQYVATAFLYVNIAVDSTYLCITFT